MTTTRTITDEQIRDALAHYESLGYETGVVGDVEMSYWDTGFAAVGEHVDGEQPRRIQEGDPCIIARGSQMGPFTRQHLHPRSYDCWWIGYGLAWRTITPWH